MISWPKGHKMGQKHDIRKLSLELRERLEKEILHPLTFLENASGSETFSFTVVDKVFRDFRKVNDGIWEELHRKINNGNGKIK